MKIQALVAVLALTGASAFANQPAKADTTQHAQATANAPEGDSMMDKTKRGLHRMGDAMRSTGKKIGNKIDKYDHRDDKAEHAANKDMHNDKVAKAHDRKHDTRAMGASGTDQSAESTRRQRMDDAYANYKKGQQR